MFCINLAFLRRFQTGDSGSTLLVPVRNHQKEKVIREYTWDAKVRCSKGYSSSRVKAVAFVVSLPLCSRFGFSSGSTRSFLWEAEFSGANNDTIECFAFAIGIGTEVAVRNLSGGLGGVGGTDV